MAWLIATNSHVWSQVMGAHSSLGFEKAKFEVILDVEHGDGYNTAGSRVHVEDSSVVSKRHVVSCLLSILSSVRRVGGWRLAQRRQNAWSHRALM